MAQTLRRNRVSAHEWQFVESWTMPWRRSVPRPPTGPRCTDADVCTWTFLRHVPFQARERVPVMSETAPRWRLDFEKGPPRGCFGMLGAAIALSLSPHAGRPMAFFARFSTACSWASAALEGLRGSSKQEFGALRCVIAQIRLGPSNLPLKRPCVRICDTIGKLFESSSAPLRRPLRWLLESSPLP